MSDWSAGYVTEIDYANAYFRDMSPNLLGLSGLFQGLGPDLDRPVRYLELGYGQGLSLNIHAAACPGEFWGNDFIPNHAAHAQEIARLSGADLRALDDSFAELAARDDLPEFDVVAMNGVWSWINDENRAIIVDILRRKLAVGGRVFIGYNCQPGWNPVIPLRNLMALHAELAGGGAGGVTGRIDRALGFAQSLDQAGAHFFTLNPEARASLGRLVDKDRAYLAHEYFNRDWAPMLFSDLARQLEAAKLGYGYPANLVDHMDGLSLTPAFQEVLNSLEHPVLRETVRDYLINRRFRKDVFIKGRTVLPSAEWNSRVRARRFVLVRPVEAVARVQLGSAGRLTLPGQLYDPLLAVLAEDGHRPKTLAEIEGHAACRHLNLLLLVDALRLLVGRGDVEPAQPEWAVERAGPTARAFNAAVLKRSAYSASAFLASPVSGAGVPVGQNAQLFLAASLNGQQGAEALAQHAYRALLAAGAAFRSDEGEVLVEPARAIPHAARLAERFLLAELPILKALGVA